MKYKIGERYEIVGVTKHSIEGEIGDVVTVTDEDLGEVKKKKRIICLDCYKLKKLKTPKKRKAYLKVEDGCYSDFGIWIVFGNGKKSFYPVFEYDQKNICNQQAKRLAKQLNLEIR